MRTLLLITLSLCFAHANSQEKTLLTSNISSEVKGLSDIEILKQAKFFSHTNPQESIKLANEALRISTENSNYTISAEAHIQLGDIQYQLNNIDQSLDHFLQASLIYQKINDKHKQIIYSINYIEILLDDRRYDQADKKADELLPIALKYGDSLSIAQTITTKGDGFYQQKQYDHAIVQYLKSLEYLSGDETDIKIHLGETYKVLAQSYKRLKNREKTAYFYTKTLEVYTQLDNKKVMARMLSALAEAERYLGNLVIALDYSIQSLELYKEIDEPAEYAKALVGAGIIYRHIGRYEKSIEHVHQAHLYYKKVGNVNGIAETSNQIGLIYTRLEQFEQARSFYQLTMSQPEEKIEPKTLASALREMATIDLDVGQYDSAILMAEKARNIYKIEKDKLKESLTARIIANIYRAQKKYTKAITYYRESLLLAKERGNIQYQIKAQTALAGVLIGKKSEEAVTLSKKSLALAIEINHKKEMLYAYRTLKRAEKSRKNYVASLGYAEKEIALGKIIQNEKDDNNLILTKANLHSYKMEIELESLREKARFDQLELVKKNNEIEIAEQESTIRDLELIKNKYATIALASLLAGCVFMVVYTYRRFIVSKKQNKELDYLATHDPLTSCYNRRILFELLSRDFVDKELLGEYCIIMADIDHFKEVNDTYGHSIGDSVLCGVANILQNSVRKNDIAARFGGEEFCIVLPGAAQNQAILIAEAMRKKIEASEFEGITVTCSFGVTSIQYNAKEPTELIEQADLALYQSKSLGRNRVTLWEDRFKA